MHYKNGREVKVGDVIITRSQYNGLTTTEVVVGATPGSTACNLATLPLVATGTLSRTASECLHVDDVAQALI